MPYDTENKYISQSVIVALYNKYVKCIIKSMRYTVKEFKKQFPDDDACLDAMFNMRYGDVKDCPRCGVVDTKFYRVKGRKCYACMHCGYQLHPLAQTIFHKSSTPLTDWFHVMFKFGNSKNGVAALEVQRDLGCTYKTALRMCHKVRELMALDIGPIGGDGLTVQADETYVGGKHRREGMYDNKMAVVGIVEKDGMAKGFVTKHADATTVIPYLRANIAPGSIVHTDESRIYTRVKRIFKHEFITHAKYEYVRGNVTTNHIESIWSQLKRSIDGTHHAVSQKHLSRYVDEFFFHYNFRGVAAYPVLLERAALPCVVKP